MGPVREGVERSVFEMEFAWMRVGMLCFETDLRFLESFCNIYGLSR